VDPKAFTVEDFIRNYQPPKANFPVHYYPVWDNGIGCPYATLDACKEYARRWPSDCLAIIKLNADGTTEIVEDYR
jgi:hypothetical protein